MAPAQTEPSGERICSRLKPTKRKINKMPRDPKLHSSMGYTIKRDSVTASDGTVFKFSPHSAKDRRAAIAKAVERSNEHGKTMEAQAGRPLTHRERISGKHSIPAEPSVPRSLKVPRDEDAAFSAVVDSVRNSSAHTVAERQVRAARLAALERVAAKREEKRIEAELAAAWAADPSTQKMIQSAETLQEMAARDPSTPPSTLRALDRLVTMTRNQVGLTFAQYVEMLRGMGLAKPDPASSAKENGLNEDVTGRLADQDFSQPGEHSTDG
jgi:hypothetical protein